MTRVRAVLFDVDGTLLDSNDAHAHAWLDALRGHGRSVPLDLVRSKIGMGADKLLQELAGVTKDSVQGRSIVERRRSVLKAFYLPDLGPVPGARSLVERVRARGMTTAAVTSANAEELADLLRAAAVADLMDVLVPADEVDRSKPDPDIVELALERLELAPEEAVFVGDTPYDVAAANRAGVPVIALRCGGWTDRDLRGAVAVYDNPADLASRIDQSPLARAAAVRPPAAKQRGRRSVARDA